MIVRRPFQKGGTFAAGPRRIAAHRRAHRLPIGNGCADSGQPCFDLSLDRSARLGLGPLRFDIDE